VTTNQQRKFYFPLWNDVCRANDWRMERGRLVGVREERFGHAEADRLYQAVWDIAEILAAREHRAVKPDDLRHACHIVALNGRESVPTSPDSKSAIRACPARAPQSAIPKLISSHTLTTTQLNRVARLFEILKDPDDLDAMIAWTDPSVDQRKGYVRWIKSMAPEAYICEVARIFGEHFTYPYWEDLPIDQLRSLARLLKKRTEAKQVGTVAPRGPSGNVGCNVTLPPSAQDAHAASAMAEVPF
jgi:hypothetical protein